MNLKEQIIKANKAYRDGNPIISDAEYDVLLAKLEDEMGVIEYISFKESLMENSGEYKHKFVVGSLNKVKYGENELSKWINKHNVKEIVVSEKLDGCSFVANYMMGKFVSGASRGDGKTGTDWTEKLKHILPETISIINSVTIRGELVLTGDSHTILGYKNPRNGVVGIMNEDKIVPEKLNHVVALVYDMPSTTLTAFQIFQELDKQFKTPKWISIDIKDNTEENLKKLLEKWKSDSNYIMDGLVISTKNYVNENVYHPEKKIAFKVNSEGVKGQVVGIDWKVSKNGSLKPVVEINPIDIDGTTVRRVTGFNAKYIKDNGIGTGVNVMVIRSGEVIPKIINVLNGYTTKINNIPTHCPSCGEKVVWNETGVEVICKNKLCDAQQTMTVTSFLTKCGVENVSEKSLVNWNITTFDDVINFKPNRNSKSECNFGLELERKVFSKSKEELFSCMSFDGAGETNINKLINAFGGSVESATKVIYIEKSNKDFPEGIGSKVVDKIRDDWFSNLKILKKIITDNRWKPVQKIVASGKYTGKTFLITGTLSEKRSVVENRIKANGGVIASSVSKSLDYLIVGSDAGSKLDKAKKLGITIIDEDGLKAL